MRASGPAVLVAGGAFKAASCLKKVDVCTRWHRFFCARRQPPCAVVLHEIPQARRFAEDPDFSVCRQAVQRFTRSPNVLWRGALKRNFCKSFQFLSSALKSDDICSGLLCLQFHATVQTGLQRHRHLDLLQHLLPTLAASVSMQLSQ